VPDGLVKSHSENDPEAHHKAKGSAVFLRRYERRSGGKKRTYWALAESIRTERGSRQRIVAYLGELTKSEQSGWAQLGR
jgi:hypothetical protein